MNDLKITILENFLKDSNSESVLVIDEKGKLEASVNVSNQESIGAMGAAIISMTAKFLDDLENGIMKQMFIKTTDSLVVFNKIDDNHALIAFSKDGKNLGLFLRSVEELALNLK